MEVRVSDQEWDLIRRYLSEIPKKKSWHGRPRAPDRGIFEGILWVLVSGGRWEDLPKTYPAKSSCHRRFQTWTRDGSLLRLHQGLVRTLSRQKQLDLSEGFTDTAVVKAKKGAHWPLMDVGEKVAKSLWLSKPMDFRSELTSVRPTRTI